MKRRGLTDGKGYGRPIVPRLEELADQIQAEDRMRLLEPTSLPKELRGYQRRPRPQTGLLSNVMLEAFKARMWAHGIDLTDEQAARIFRGEQTGQ